VDEFAAHLLLEILRKPDTAPEPALNPFSPVGALENWPQSKWFILLLILDSFIDSIKEKKEEEKIPKKFDEEILKHLKVDDKVTINKDANIKNIIMNIKGIGTDVDDQPKKVIPNNFNQVLATYIKNKSNAEIILI
jgi:hypothetical protein